MSSLKKILYAEDDLDIQIITVMALEASHYLVEACDSGKEIMDKAILFKPDLILLDVMMPEVDGITAFFELKKSEDTKNIPVIFITAKVNKEDMDHYKAIGSAGVICKPFDPNVLPDAIEAIYKNQMRGQ